MSVWKLGCRWGKGNPLFFDFLFENSIVIGVTDKAYAFGDVVLLTDGFKAIGIAKVVSSPVVATDHKDYKAVFESFQIEFKDHILVYKANVFRLSEADQFQYPLQQGIVQIHHEHAEKALAMLAKYLGSLTMNELMDILREKKQIILQGAPGVGKTYTTKELALRIAGEAITDDRAVINEKYSEAVQRGQIVFCTFHQSMDYEDFVEGYKPSDDNGDVPTFVRRDGPFKTICRSCRGRADESTFEVAWAKFIAAFEDSPIIKASTVSKNTTFYIRLTENGALRVGTREDQDGQYTMTKQQIKNHILNNEEPSYNPSYAKGTAKLLQEQYGAPTYSLDPKRRPHILIIDEINRGNVSKIFGELITLLETDKREAEPGKTSEALTAKLTYSQEPFSVPYNLYIIGTMNTADRSVGQIDYALRRRFAFYTIKSNRQSLESYYNGKDNAPRDTALSLFDRIELFFKTAQNVNRDFDPDDIMIGHSYFMAESTAELAHKLRFELAPLLEEYRKDGILSCEKDDPEYRSLLEGIGARE